jgi:Sec-independent protein translocase protein TatA
MKGVGKGVKSFKEGLSDVENQIKSDVTKDDKQDTVK